MNGFLTRVLTPSARFGLICLIGVALTPKQAVSQQKPVNVEDVFKNIQALKGISAADFMGTMGVMTAALGFDCADCHTGAGTDKVDWAFDTPRKRISRRMVTMVAAINKDNFGGRQVVTCWTCHRGRDRPLVTPTVDGIYAAPVIEMDDVFRAAPGQPSADQILDKYMQALGGMQKVSGVTSIVGTGVSIGFGSFGGGGTVQFYAKAPAQRTTIIEFASATARDSNVRSFNGTSGWVKTPLSVLGEYALTGGELDGAKLDAQLTFPGQIKQVLSNLRVGLPVTLNDRDVQVVQGETREGIIATLYFDMETGLLSRVIRYAKSPIGRVPTQIDYSDYREVGGVKMPFRWVFGWLDGKDSIELRDVRINVPIEAAKFGRQTPQK